MSYEYGSSEFVIRNPFRLEGFLTTLRGVVLGAMGVLLLLGVRSQVDAGLQPVAITFAVVGFALVTSGLVAMGRGFAWMFRFFVGRGVPSGLAREVRADRTDPGQHLYAVEQLAAMLMGRKNLSFQEPKAWLSRAVQTLSPNVIFVPPRLFQISLRLFAASAYTLVYFVAFGIAIASGFMGLTRITETPVVDWLGWALVAISVLIWFRHRPGSKATTVDFGNTRTLALLLSAAIVAPTVLVQVHMNAPLPEAPLTPFMSLGVVLTLTVLAGAFATALVFARSPMNQPQTEVSEFREHWQESVHPMDIFRAFDMVLANHRVLEMPNRVYREVDPQLIARDDKGSFHGDALSEIQPQPVENDPSSPLLRGARVAGICVGQLLLLLSGVILFQAVSSIEGEVTLAGLEWILIAALANLFGRAIASVSHWYSSEIYFESNIIQLIANGTFTESTVSTGTSVFDSNRSENTVIRSSITPWILSGRALTSTLAVGGPQNLEQTRFVHSLDRNDPLMSLVAKGVKDFLSGRQVIAEIGSEADLRVAANMHSINEQTRAPSPQLSVGAAGGSAADADRQVAGGEQEALPPHTPPPTSPTE